MEKLLEMKEICKSFGTNNVLKNVQFDLFAGEVHALIGENGAGKSTLMKILMGMYKKDSGSGAQSRSCHDSSRTQSDSGYVCC